MTSEEWQNIAIHASGSIGDLTMYTTRYGTLVIYPKTQPTGPPSPLQLQHRDRFRRAQAAWSALSDADKLALETATKTLSMNYGGQSLYMHLAMQTNTLLRETIIRSTGQPLPPIPFVPFLP